MHSLTGRPNRSGELIGGQHVRSATNRGGTLDPSLLGIGKRAIELVAFVVRHVLDRDLGL